MKKIFQRLLPPAVVEKLKKNLDFNVKFVSTEHESQVMSNGLSFTFHLYWSQALNRYTQETFITETADIEIMEDQYQIAAVDKEQGIVCIYRVNANQKIKRKTGWPRNYLMPSFTSDQ